MDLRRTRRRSVSCSGISTVPAYYFLLLVRRVVVGFGPVASSCRRRTPVRSSTNGSAYVTVRFTLRPEGYRNRNVT